MAEGVWPGVAHCCGEACSGLVRGFNSYIGPAVLHPTIHVEGKPHIYLYRLLVGLGMIGIEFLRIRYVYAT